MTRPRLLLGPVLRHVGETTATVWVQTDRPATVEVLGCAARTFTVCGHYFALVDVDGLRPGSVTRYEVHLDGERAWPRDGSSWPASRIRTRGGTGRLRVVFGSCRYAKPDELRRARILGIDALDVYAGRLAAQQPEQWPDALLLLGDQVYADDPTPQLRRWLATRRDLARPPWFEVANFTEYARLYTESWSDEELRWLLSTVPTAMIFDDHDVRDDWNTSAAWRACVKAQSWWTERIRGGLASYWVYQHAGNLDPAERAADAVYRRVVGAEGDAWPVLERVADAVDVDPTSIRWSFRWDLGRVRLVMVDTRCGRVLTEGARAMLDDAGFEWVEQAVANDAAAVDHILVGSSLPWLLPPAISDVQSANEVACGRGSRLAERVRQGADLEHWAAFRGSFDRFTTLLRRVAFAPTGPASVSVLSGDVHHSYAARASFSAPERTPVFQLVCSPVHQGVPWYLRVLLRLAWTGPLARMTRRFARRAGVSDPGVSWQRITGPHFGNALATLALDGRRAGLTIERARRHGRSARLEPVSKLSLTGRPPGCRTSGRGV